MKASTLRRCGDCRCSMSARIIFMPWARPSRCPNPRRISSARPPAIASPPKLSTEWMSSRSKPPRAAPRIRCARAGSPIFSNAAPIGCARIRCSTPSSIGSDPRSRPGKARSRSCASRAGSSPIASFMRMILADIEAGIAAEIEKAVAFAEAGTWEPPEDFFASPTRAA